MDRSPSTRVYERRPDLRQIKPDAVTLHGDHHPVTVGLDGHFTLVAWACL